MHERRYNINSIWGFEATRMGGGNGRLGQCEISVLVRIGFSLIFLLQIYLRDNKGVS